MVPINVLLSNYTRFRVFLSIHLKSILNRSVFISRKCFLLKSANKRVVLSNNLNHKLFNKKNLLNELTITYYKLRIIVG